MPDPRRMRRFRDSEGVEYDEIPNGSLRRRLKRGDPSRIPPPQSREAIEREAGRLVEIDPQVLACTVTGGALSQVSKSARLEIVTT